MSAGVAFEWPIYDGVMLTIHDLCIAEMVQLREAGKVKMASWALPPPVCVCNLRALALPCDCFDYCPQ